MSLASHQNDAFIKDSCWSRAHHCPSSSTTVSFSSLSDSVGAGAGARGTVTPNVVEGTGNQNHTTCEAWYRCDSLSNYVINWWCHGPTTNAGNSASSPYFSNSLSSSSSSSSSSSLKPTTLLQCDNSSSSRRMNTKLCPPPVVCPLVNPNNLDHNNVQVTKDDTIDVDIILAVLLALFAILVLVLMAVLGFKYWKARRRHHRRFYHPRHRLDRPYSALQPTSQSSKINNKNGTWFPTWTGFPRQLKFVGKSGTVNGVQYTDVYIPSQSQPAGTPSHVQHHHTKERATSDSRKNHKHNHNGQHLNNQNHHQSSNHNRGVYRTASRSPRLKSRVKRAGRLPGDIFYPTDNSNHHHSIAMPRRIWRNTNVRDQRSGSSSSGRKDVYSPKVTGRRRIGVNKIGLQEWMRGTRKYSGSSNSFRSHPSSFYFDRHGGGFYLNGHNREIYNVKAAPSNVAKPVQYFVSSPTPEYHSIISSNDSSSSNSRSSPGIKRRPVPVVSSIHIPSYEDSHKINNKTTNLDNHASSRIPYDLSKKYNLLLSNTSYETMKDPYLNYGYHGDSVINNGAVEHDGSECGSWRSMSSISPYAMGRIHCKDGGCGMSEAASIASKNWQYTVFSQQQQQQQQQYHHHRHHQHRLHQHQRNTTTTKTNVITPTNADVVRASSMKYSSNYFLNSYYKPPQPTTEIVKATTAATPNSPDVVSSHNVSRHVARGSPQDGSSSSNGSSNTHHLQNHHHHHHHHHHHREETMAQHHHHHNNHNHRNEQSDQLLPENFVARITVPSYTQCHRHQHELNTTEINGGNILLKNIENNEDFKIHRNYTQRVHIPGNVHDTWRANNTQNTGDASIAGDGDGDGDESDRVLMSQELSYDCFRNEHLRQLAQQEAATSASTLDVGQLNTNNIRVIPWQY